MDKIISRITLIIKNLQINKISILIKEIKINNNNSKINNKNHSIIKIKIIIYIKRLVWKKIKDKKI